jgi:hypothetical protein
VKCCLGDQREQLQLYETSIVILTWKMEEKCTQQQHQEPALALADHQLIIVTHQNSKVSISGEQLSPRHGACYILIQIL